MPLRHPAVLALWLAAAAGGFLLARWPGENQAPVTGMTGDLSSAPLPSPARALPLRAEELAAAESGEMRALFARYDALPDPVERGEAISWLMARWVELDPREAVSFFRERNRRDEVREIHTQWALLDPVAAAGELQQVTQGALLDAEVWKALAFRDGRAAIEFALAYPESPAEARRLDPPYCPETVAEMAKADFAGALKVLERFPGTGGVLTPYHAAAAGRAEVDPAGALEWARGLEKGRAMAVGAVLHVMAAADPRAAAAEFLRTPELMERARDGDSAGSLVKDITVRLGRTDLAAALDWLTEAVANETQRADLKHDAASRILKEALTTPERLTEVFRALEGSLNADSHYFPSLAPPPLLRSALEAVENLPAGAARDRLLANLATQEAALPAGLAEALRRLDTITDPTARGRFADSVSTRRGPEAAARAAELYETLPADLKYRVVLNIAASQAREDGPAGVAWAAALPENEGRLPALAAAVSAWTESDAGAASSWVDALPPGAERDAAADRLAEAIQRREPSSAFLWSMNIGDPARRAESLYRTVKSWAASDPAAARAAVEGAGLPEARRDELLQLTVSP